MQSIRNRLDHLYWSIQTSLAPDLKYSQLIYEDVLKEELTPGCRWLDLGCGHQLLPEWRHEEEIKILKTPGLVVGTDLDLPSLRQHFSIANLVYGNLEQMPFASSTFDFATSNMVFEHLENPNRVLIEIYRVMKPGGKLVIHTPNFYGYATLIARMMPDVIKNILIKLLERDPEDVFKAYYRINKPGDILSLANESSFILKKMKMIVSTPQSASILPFGIAELFLIKFLMKPALKRYRSNIIAVLVKDSFVTL